jgi:hypothetical protein
LFTANSLAYYNYLAQGSSANLTDRTTKEAFMTGRTRVGMMVLIIGACVSAGRQIADVFVTASPQEGDAEVVADYDAQRFAGLSDVLPPGGVAGYLTSTKHNSNPDRSHALAQYVLAPCLIVLGVEQPLVLVDYGSDEETPPTLAGRPLLRELPNGVRLYGTEEAR